ncbi:MAG: hypothetical protein GF364_07930, partial [Candidatus Lokiarchaeota archaeon]|nr:hypothetical protein [Candidatus Lokiarchaeota archaeon]
MNREQAENDVIVYIAIWDEQVGPVISNSIAKNTSIDLEEISLQVFQSFQIVFGSASEISFN